MQTVQSDSSEGSGRSQLPVDPGLQSHISHTLTNLPSLPSLPQQAEALATSATLSIMSSCLNFHLKPPLSPAQLRVQQHGGFSDNLGKCDL